MFQLKIRPPFTLSSQLRRRSAITLLEIAVVIVVLGILTAIVVPKWVDLRQEAATASENYIISSIQEALATYNAAQHVQP